MSGLQSVGNTIKTGIAKASDLRPVKWVSKKFTQNPESALATATVTSIILKDGIGCAMYVGQSLHNDKIPEKKRKFVAALDLTNGVGKVDPDGPGPDQTEKPKEPGEDIMGGEIKFNVTVEPWVANDQNITM